MHIQRSTRVAHIFATDAREAAREFHASVEQAEMTLAIFFCSKDYDLDVLGAEIRNLFAGVQVVGCTTAGEIGPGGYHSLTGASFSAAACTAVSGHIKPLQQFELSAAQGGCKVLIRSIQTALKKTSLILETRFRFRIRRERDESITEPCER